MGNEFVPPPQGQRMPSSAAFAFYEFVKEKTLGNSSFVTQRQAWQHLRDKGIAVAWNENQNQHNDHCRVMKSYIDQINVYVRLDKLIHWEVGEDGSYRYCIATEEQAKEIVEGYRNKAMKALSRLSLIESKMNRDGQGKTVTNQDREMNASAEEFHQAFNVPAPQPKTHWIRCHVQDGDYEYLQFIKGLPEGNDDEASVKAFADRLKPGLQVKAWEVVE